MRLLPRSFPYLAVEGLSPVRTSRTYGPSVRAVRTASGDRQPCVRPVQKFQIIIGSSHLIVHSKHGLVLRGVLTLKLSDGSIGEH